MIGKDSKEELQAYAPWPWIVGYLLAAIIAGLMFGLATGFL